MSEIEVPQKRRAGRPKTVSVDKKEYQKQYYQKNRESLLEGKKEYYTEHKDEIREYQKEYVEKLKENNPEKFQELREKQKELSIELQRKERALYKLIKDLYISGLLSVDNTHKELISELIN